VPGPTTDDDFDPAAVPIRHAATVMILDDRGPDDDLHVLMVHRTAKVVFAPDMWVFPGGRVDPDDHLDDFDTICRGLSDEEASTVLEVDRGGLAWWVAGVVTHRQRPATASGTTFLGLEDETGLINVVVSVGCWTRYRYAARSSPALLIRGRVERQEAVVNIVAEKMEPLAVGGAPRSRDFR